MCAKLICFQFAYVKGRQIKSFTYCDVVQHRFQRSSVPRLFSAGFTTGLYLVLSISAAYFKRIFQIRAQCRPASTTMLMQLWAAGTQKETNTILSSKYIKCQSVNELS